MRNPRIIRTSILYHTSIIKHLTFKARQKGQKGITYLDEDFSFLEWTEETIIAHFSDKVTKTFKEKHIGGIGELGNFHEYSKLEVSKNKSTAQFFTSDNPVVVEDAVEGDGQLLQKTKEFTIALTPQYSLRIYHDNRLNLNIISRPTIPNGNTASTNHSTFGQASRFVVGKRQALEEYFKMTDLLEDTTFDRKVDFMRQMVEMYSRGRSNDKNHKELIELTKYYLSIYANQELKYRVNKSSGNFTKDMNKQTICRSDFAGSLKVRFFDEPIEQRLDRLPYS
jgi:Protein of unknown function (DUF4238)